jgi:hypothetical protein
MFGMMVSAKVVRLFIIYAWQHHELYEQLVAFLDTLPDFYWINNSVARDRTLSRDNFSELDIRNYLTDRIKISDCVLIILSDNIAREWIRFEVKVARSLGKPIIGIKPDKCDEDYSSVVKPDMITSLNDASIVDNLTV